MLAWYFERTDVLRLSTDPKTRAADFYAKAGYTNIGPTAKGREVIFELRSGQRKS